MLKWLVVGIGDITTKRVIPALLEEKRSELWGIVTRDPAKAAPYGVRAFTNLDAALAAGGADVVYVASPVFLHAPQTLAALRAGKQVLCEKPMAMNYAEARVDGGGGARGGQDAGSGLLSPGVSQGRREPKSCSARVRLASRCSLTSPARIGDQARAPSGTGCVDPTQAGGGPLFDIGSHRIDVLNFLFGEPRRVTGQLSNAVQSLDVEDCATVLIDYASKVRGIVDVRWNSHVRRDELRIIGTDGEMDLTPLSGPDLIYPGGREELPPSANFHFPCIENYVAAVLDGAPLLASGESSLWTDWVTEQVVLQNPR